MRMLIVVLVIFMVSCDGNEPSSTEMTESNKVNERAYIGMELTTNVSPTRTISDSLYMYLINRQIELLESGGMLFLGGNNRDFRWVTTDEDTMVRQSILLPRYMWLGWWELNDFAAQPKLEEIFWFPWADSMPGYEWE